MPKGGTKIPDTEIKAFEDWETGQSAVVSQNKQGDTIINSSPPLINFRTWIRDKKHPFHNNKFLDFRFNIMHSKTRQSNPIDKIKSLSLSNPVVSKSKTINSVRFLNYDNQNYFNEFT